MASLEGNRLGSSLTQELDVDMFSLLVYPLRSRGKDGHFADAQIVSGVKYSLNKRYYSLTCGLQPDISHRGAHLHKSKKNGMLDQSLRQVAKMCGNYFIREAMPSDKDDVLNIRKDLYGGLDYMPDCYDKLVSIPNGKAFVAIHRDKVVGFTTLSIIDGGENCNVKGTRISEKHEGKGLMPLMFKYASEWARANGAVNYVSTISDDLWYKGTLTGQMFNLIYIVNIENIALPESDLNATETVLPIPFEDVAVYTRSEDIRNYLFPCQRMVVDIIPYKLIESNATRMKEISGYHTIVYSDVNDNNKDISGILSFGTLIRTQKLPFVYGIDMYGTDKDSIRKHIFRHLLALKKCTYGSIFIMFFLPKTFPQNVLNKICLELEMNRVNYNGTEYPQWNFQTMFLIEVPLP